MRLGKRESVDLWLELELELELELQLLELFELLGGPANSRRPLSRDSKNLNTPKRLVV